MNAASIEIRNPVRNAHGGIDCEINHPEFGWIPFTASPDDDIQFGREMFARLSRDTVADYVPPPPPGPSAYRLSRWQFHAMLEIMGIRGAVYAAIEAIPDATSRAVARAKLTQASYFDRSDPLIALLAPSVGLTDAQIDAAWMQAKDLE